MNYVYLKNNQFKFATLPEYYGTFMQMNDNIYAFPLKYSKQYMTYVEDNKIIPLMKNNIIDYKVNNLQNEIYTYNYNWMIINPFINLAIEINNPTELNTSSINILLYNNDELIETYNLLINTQFPKVYQYTIISYAKYKKLTVMIDTPFTGVVNLRIVGDKY